MWLVLVGCQSLAHFRDHTLGAHRAELILFFSRNCHVFAWGFFKTQVLWRPPTLPLFSAIQSPGYGMRFWMLSTKVIGLGDCGARCSQSWKPNNISHIFQVDFPLVIQTKIAATWKKESLFRSRWGRYFFSKGLGACKISWILGLPQFLFQMIVCYRIVEFGG